MTHVLLRGLRARSRRFAGTFLAIFLGVAFLSGTLVLGDTLKANFDDMFAEANAGTDIVVRNATDVSSDDSLGVAPIDGNLLDVVRGIDGVAAAEPSIRGYGQIVSADGDLIGGNGPPTIAGNWIENEALNPYELSEGRAPQSDDEVVINRGAAKSGDLRVGDEIEVRVPQPVKVRVVGLATFGGADGLGPTTFTAFTLDAAQRYFMGGTDRVSTVQVQAEDGVDSSTLLARIDDAMPDGVETITGTELTDENISDISNDFLNGFRTLLVVFAAIALLVASFSIHNTFSIVVAQRTHESALLRALGATRGQILGSVVVEALLLGIVASVVGLFGGIGIATLLKALFEASGFSALPTGGLKIEPAGVVIALLVGVVVTVLAGIAPALHAGRVAPLAAMRDVAVERTSPSRARVISGPVVTAAGVALVIAGAAGAGGMTAISFGALLTVIGLVVAGPLFARPVSSVLGAPLAATRGVTGSLARQNAMRSPKRTARTASALMIGVGVVTLFTVFAASVKASIEDAIDESFTGDLVVSAGAFGGSGFSPELGVDIAQLPEVDSSVGLGNGSVQIDGDAKAITVADAPALAQVTDLDVNSGRLESLGADQIAVSESVAEDNGWTDGSEIEVTFADGATQVFTVGAVYDRTAIVGNYVMPREAWAPHSIQDIDQTVLIGLVDGVSVAEGRQAVQVVSQQYGNPDLLTRAEYVDDMAAGVDMALSIVYVLLALAILIAAMGIANTLSLSIHERRRELGLLRAVGQDRSQTRAMVRWESVIVSVFGTVVGVALGAFLGWGLMQGVADADAMPLGSFALPYLQLTIVLVVGGLAGVLAGIRPARRAARLDVLAAVNTD